MHTVTMFHINFILLHRFERTLTTLAAFHVQDNPMRNSIYRETFGLLDTDRNGVLSINEVTKGMRRLHVEIPGDMQSIFASIDADNNGYIDYTEFVASAISDADLCHSETVKFVFMWIDEANKGYISHTDISRLIDESTATLVFRGYEETIDIAELRRIFHTIASSRGPTGRIMSD